MIRGEDSRPDAEWDKVERTVVHSAFTFTEQLLIRHLT
jgi:hypothetical protein